MEIKQIKIQLPIKTVLKTYNLTADKNGMLHCPFHEDKKPSLKIYENTNTFYCFGCGATGDQIEFIQKKRSFDRLSCRNKIPSNYKSQTVNRLPTARNKKEPTKYKTYETTGEPQPNNNKDFHDI